MFCVVSLIYKTNKFWIDVAEQMLIIYLTTPDGPALLIIKPPIFYNRRHLALTRLGMTGNVKCSSLL